jgi:hypothetical protein
VTSLLDLRNALGTWSGKRKSYRGYLSFGSAGIHPLNTVITSDTVFLYRNIEENVPVGYFYNLEECYDAMETIRNVADVILPTHDPEVLVRHPGGV